MTTFDQGEGPRPLRRLAPAKVNLSLAVTGRRADGYHLLDSLVVFADLGETLEARAAEDLTLAVTGPRSGGVPTDGRNLVLKAAALLRERRDVRTGAALSLRKALPHGGGVGGGSSDAAAALALLARLWGVEPLSPKEALILGADVPVCMAAPGPQRMRGVGDEVAPLAALPRAALWIVAPPLHLSTPAVFAERARIGTAGPGAMPPAGADLSDLAVWLRAEERNHLAEAAYSLAPELRDVRAVLEGTDALAVGLSGSGAAHWALCREGGASLARLREAHPEWIVLGGPILTPDAPLDA
ncbi:4-diphosphocytidyl-2-C-methyl-D-erythritol kinase [Hasllibacter halocynthiae]|uniref:4-diphosphocytidyl-2-C-methyl-D-erythritol kinase n=1 Tax=Hasllibacter halocynthiae TaxID=595589 RepID=A0A2T0X3Y5_9RHOB|nr:4-(cytidine 5'-diphospho)-2-C-methyl-D-erythritol kinase [Hasllibacter halocynthiae]PRY93627.1 4-diphosphocytidyl-2-C-methyl-D-erythritol kinase [Hasllibacter halocynthiae]